MHKTLLLACALLIAGCSAVMAYGPIGHQIVGAIADEKLADPPTGRLPHTKKLHGFWDSDTVDALMPATSETATKEERRAVVDPAKDKLAHEMAAEEPKNWRLPANVELRNAGEFWADEILPLARQAHDRMTFAMHPLQQEDRTVAAGNAEEKPVTEGQAYKEWATQVVREELHKAGWRLADLLTRSLKPEATSAASPSPSGNK